MIGLRALGLLTGSLLRRLLREGLVVRSLSFPVALTAGTLLATLLVVTWTRSPPIVAVTPAALDADFEAELEQRDLTAVVSGDPRAAVLDGTATAGTDGTTVWTLGADRSGLNAEAALRVVRGASWRPDPGPLPRALEVTQFGTMVGRLLCAIFALYGVVFGAGMVARDRDDGTFEVELALAVPRWVHGAARVLSGTLVLWGFVAFSVIAYDALAGLGDAAAMVRHGFAACLAAIALGLMVVGTRGLKAGFAATLAGGLSAVTGLMVVGWMVPGLAAWLPLASILSDGAGWAPLAGSLVVGVAAVAVFTLRSARA